MTPLPESPYCRVRTLIPPAARRWIYAVYVLAYLAVPLAVLAGVNVPVGGDWIDGQADDGDLLDDPDDEDDPYFVSESTLREIDRQRQ